MAAEIRIAHIGFKAHAALAAAGHRARVLATLSESIYLTAGDEIVWLGAGDGALHGRALLTPTPGGAHDAKPPDVRGDTVSFDVAAAQRWQP
ncbi:MAG: hypothetical protein HY728_00575, partial [Candidatus Rokubacteria bacterium]|nr:hypothetical protein [Candidatus Rokubacteria bacterium]